MASFETFIDTLHVGLDPLQAPPHPANVELGAGFAVSVTLVPSVYGAMQSLPQLIPAGLLVTMPLPVPVFVTVRTGLFENVAVTVRGPFICRVHVEVLPVQAPLQPANVAPAVAWAVSVTPVPNS
jgi:hypothetical protein